MTKSTITREQLEEWVAQFEEDGGCDATDRQLEALIRQSLAAMDSEPVAWTWQHREHWHVTNCEGHARELAWDGVKVEPLYRHAQPAPVVPDGYVMVPKEPTAEMILSAMRDNETGEVAEIYELMLAATPQSPSSEPATVPGKWIPVSERMPKRGQEVLCTDQFENYETALYDAGYIPGPPFFATTAGEFHPTHWMPLPAAPQEVKGE